jgi:hypothetical protein
MAQLSDQQVSSLSQLDFLVGYYFDFSGFDQERAWFMILPTTFYFIFAIELCLSFLLLVLQLSSFKSLNIFYCPR